MIYRVVVRKGPQSGFVAFVPGMLECIAQAETVDEVISNLKDELVAYNQALVDDGLALESDANPDAIQFEIVPE